MLLAKGVKQMLRPEDLTDTIELLGCTHPCLIAGTVTCPSDNGPVEVPILLAVMVEGRIFSDPYMATQFGMEFGPDHLWFTGQHRAARRPKHEPVTIDEAMEDWLTFPSPDESAAKWYHQWWRKNVTSNTNIPGLKTRLLEWIEEHRLPTKPLVAA